MSQSSRDDEVLQAFRTAVRRALELGFDAELLAEEVAHIWRDEFMGDDDD